MPDKISTIQGVPSSWLKGASEQKITNSEDGLRRAAKLSVPPSPPPPKDPYVGAPSAFGSKYYGENIEEGEPLAAVLRAKADAAFTAASTTETPSLLIPSRSLGSLPVLRFEIEKVPWALDFCQRIQLGEEFLRGATEDLDEDALSDEPDSPLISVKRRIEGSSSPSHRSSARRKMNSIAEAMGQTQTRSPMQPPPETKRIRTEPVDVPTVGYVDPKPALPLDLLSMKLTKRFGSAPPFSQPRQTVAIQQEGISDIVESTLLPEYLTQYQTEGG